MARRPVLTSLIRDRSKNSVEGSNSCDLEATLTVVTCIEVPMTREILVSLLSTNLVDNSSIGTL